MTTFAVVLRCAAVERHPDPAVTRLDVITLSSGVQLVTGHHYRAGDLGVYFRAGCLIPGWLAEDLWMCGKERSRSWFEVQSKPIGVGDGPRVESPGLWAGQFWRDDVTQPFGLWKFWRPEWIEGFTLDGYFGVVEAIEQPKGTRHEPRHTARVRKKLLRPRSSTAERSAERQVPVPQGIALAGPKVSQEAEGATDVSASPGAGSIPRDSA